MIFRCAVSMMKQTQSLVALLLLILLDLLTIFTVVEGGKLEAARISNSFAKKLFVFGDSYVDTGNFLNSPSFKPPSGITFPGKPGGRFCDGLVLSDYIASYLKIRSPVPYMQRESVEKSMLAYGMNFAHGGTGVFNTLVDGPNMTNQIDFFQNLIRQNVYTKQDLESSLALVNAASNDYATYEVKNGSKEDLPAFTASLVGQISLNLGRIHRLGVSKIAIGLVEPMGCLPLLSVASSYQKCIEEANSISNNHNKMLIQKVKDMNHETGQPVFITLDLYNAFLSTISTMQKRHTENSTTTMNPLEPCCVGSSAKYSCGSVDGKGAKKYRVCEKPELSFFWDTVHPAQNAWLAVYKDLQSSLQQLSQKIF